MPCDYYINYLIKYIQENDTFLYTNEEKSYSSTMVNLDTLKHKKETEEESFDDSFQCDFNNTGNNKLRKNSNESDFEKNNKFVEINFSDLKMKNNTNNAPTISAAAKRNNSACKIINHDKFKVNNYSDLQNRNSNMNNNKSSLSSLNSPEKLNIYDKYKLYYLDRFHVKVDEKDKNLKNEE